MALQKLLDHQTRKLKFTADGDPEALPPREVAGSSHHANLSRVTPTPGGLSIHQTNQLHPAKPYLDTKLTRHAQNVRKIR